ncbi:hypothetical protein Agub_g1036, partial [Astrephomene gubernaculifera]
MLGAALRSVAQKGADLARQLADDATSAVSSVPMGQYAGYKFQRDFKMGLQTGTAGPHGLWRIFAGTARSPTAITKDVSIWVLDKRELANRGNDNVSLQGGGPSVLFPPQQLQRWETVLEQQRHGCALMTRLKHPGVVRVVLPLEETAAHMVLVTEAVRGCLREQLQPPPDSAASPFPPSPSPPPPLCALESKLGLLALAEVLAFLHGSAALAHCGVAPQSVMVAADGSWKLAGFSFAVPLGSGASAGGASCPPFSYSDPFPPPWEELAKPQLPYTAPELVVPPGGSSWSPAPAPSWAAADSFSLGALAFELALAVEAAAGSVGGAVEGA